MNLATLLEYQEAKAKMKINLPKVNAKWDPNSSNNFQPYFVEQKTRTNGVNGS